MVIEGGSTDSSGKKFWFEIVGRMVDVRTPGGSDELSSSPAFWKFALSAAWVLSGEENQCGSR